MRKVFRSSNPKFFICSQGRRRRQNLGTNKPPCLSKPPACLLSAPITARPDRQPLSSWSDHPFVSRAPHHDRLTRRWTLVRSGMAKGVSPSDLDGLTLSQIWQLRSVSISQRASSQGRSSRQHANKIHSHRCCVQSGVLGIPDYSRLGGEYTFR